MLVWDLTLKAKSVSNSIWKLHLIEVKLTSHVVTNVLMPTT